MKTDGSRRRRSLPLFPPWLFTRSRLGFAANVLLAIALNLYSAHLYAKQDSGVLLLIMCVSLTMALWAGACFVREIISALREWRNLRRRYRDLCRALDEHMEKKDR